MPPRSTNSCLNEFTASNDQKGVSVRAGAHALSLLSVPLNVHVITALEERPLPLTELRRAVGFPPQTTMRKHLRSLTQLGVLDRRREADFPGSVDYALGPGGRELLSVIHVLQTWLADSPDGPLQPGSIAAKSAIRALTDGWSSTVVRALAVRPLSLTELNRLISSLNYPSLERRLGAMRLAGQIAPCSHGGRSRPYAATPWLRRAIGPLVAAASWERQFDGVEAAPVMRIDVESALLLTVPLLKLPPNMSGAARMAVELRTRDGGSSFAGVSVGVEAGDVVSCVSRLQGPADAWASGSVGSWLGAVHVGDYRGLEIGGDRELATAIILGLQNSRYRVRQAA
ncbi:MAG: putative cytosolic protein [Solirubrobacterales bacterium]|nr:putative cytosolic protein [Solirubrobacterales bacterium]